jgi:hypothetical protein
MNSICFARRALLQNRCVAQQAAENGGCNDRIAEYAGA